MNQLNSNVCIDYESNWLNELTKSIVHYAPFYSHCIVIVAEYNDRYSKTQLCTIWKMMYERKRFRFCPDKLNTVCSQNHLCESLRSSWGHWLFVCWECERALHIKNFIRPHL